jgi:hypothetical protein
MRILMGMTLIGGLVIGSSLALAQRPGGPGGGPRGGNPDDFVARMMEFDKDKDGKLTRDEVTDERLTRLFDRADANKDGTVTKEELTALATREQANDRGGPGGFGPPGGGPPGFGPPGFGPPRPGVILPPMLQQRLNLSTEQKAQIEALQKEVDAKLEKILNDEQRTQLKEMRERGPGGFGPPPGGPPPGGPDGFGPPPGRGRGRPDGEGPPPPPDGFE